MRENSIRESPNISQSFTQEFLPLFKKREKGEGGPGRKGNQYISWKGLNSPKGKELIHHGERSYFTDAPQESKESVRGEEKTSDPVMQRNGESHGRKEKKGLGRSLPP